MIPSQDCPFEIHGYFEEFLNAETYKMLGTRKIEAPDRPLGATGMKEYTLTEPLNLVKGYKQTPIVVRASKKSPVKVLGMIQAITGKLKNQK